MIIIILFEIRRSCITYCLLFACRRCVIICCSTSVTTPTATYTWKCTKNCLRYEWPHLKQRQASRLEYYRHELSREVLNSSPAWTVAHLLINACNWLPVESFAVLAKHVDLPITNRVLFSVYRAVVCRMLSVSYSDISMVTKFYRNRSRQPYLELTKQQRSTTFTP